jgi:hypothetical protein
MEIDKSWQEKAKAEAILSNGDFINGVLAFQNKAIEELCKYNDDYIMANFEINDQIIDIIKLIKNLKAE